MNLHGDLVDLDLQKQIRVRDRDYKMEYLRMQIRRDRSTLREP